MLVRIVIVSVEPPRTSRLNDIVRSPRRTLRYGCRRLRGNRCIGCPVVSGRQGTVGDRYCSQRSYVRRRE